MRCAWLISAFALLAALGPARSHAQPASRTLVLPLRAVGVSQATAITSSELLAGDLERFGLDLVAGGSAGPCSDPACASALGREFGATSVVYGSLTRLGDRLIARVERVQVGEPAPRFRDRLTTDSEDDLDGVMRRFAEAIAQGRSGLRRASVYSITEADEEAPARRGTRKALGVRAGFLIPTGGSFGGSGRLGDLRAVYRHEVGDLLIETTPIVGLSWSEDVRDWTMFELSFARLVGSRDVSSYYGVGFGVHQAIIDGTRIQRHTPPGGSPADIEVPWSQSLAAPTLDLFAGLMAYRTAELAILVEIRFHHMFARYDEIGGRGASGVKLSLGTGL